MKHRLFTLFILLASLNQAEAASLKVCFKDIDPDATSVRLFAGAQNVGSWDPRLFLPALDGSICSTLSPVPVSITRGTPLTYTLKAANALGEESPPSNGLPFRLPNLPGAPTLMSVAATVP